MRVRYSGPTSMQRKSMDNAVTYYQKRGLETTPPEVALVFRQENGSRGVVSLNSPRINIPGAVSNKGVFAGALKIGQQLVDFTITGMSDDDALDIKRLSLKKYKIQLLQKKPKNSTREARCADGTTGVPCVNCLEAGRVVTICV